MSHFRLSSSKNHSVLTVEVETVSLANGQQLVHLVIPNQESWALPPPLEDTTNTVAAMTACRQRDNGLCYYTITAITFLSYNPSQGPISHCQFSLPLHGEVSAGVLRHSELLKVDSPRS